MNREEIQQMINDAIRMHTNAQQFGVSQVALHTHNGIDSPVIKSPITSYMGQVSINGSAGPIFPTGWQVVSPSVGIYIITHNLGITDKNYTIFASSLDPGRVYRVANATNDNYSNVVEIHWDTVQIGFATITFTGSVSSGATSATLTTAWVGRTSDYFVIFSTGEIRAVLFTDGSTAVSWTPALTATATSTAGIQGTTPILTATSFMFSIIVGSTSTNVH